MTKEEWLQIWKIPAEEAEAAWAAKVAMMNRTAPINAPMVMSEEKLYKPYKSMQTGEIIEGRAQHRKHLKAHGLVEVGNEPIRKQPDRYDGSGLKQELIRQFYK